MALDAPVLAAIQGASVLGGPPPARAPASGCCASVASPVRRWSAPAARATPIARASTCTPTSPCGPADRPRLEHLCRYVLRPPLAQDALTLTPEGHVLLRLRRPWRDGTRAIRFAPSELLEKLAAMIPRPRANLLIYHGAVAPRGCGRDAAGRGLPAASERPSPPAAGAPSDGSAGAPTPAGGGAPSAPGAGPPAAPRGPPPAAAYLRPRHIAWAELLRRPFALDVLACPDCGGRLRLVATIADRQVIEKILAHLGLPLAPPRTAPARSPAWLPAWPD